MPSGSPQLKSFASNTNVTRRTIRQIIIWDYLFSIRDVSTRDARQRELTLHSVCDPLVCNITGASKSQDWGAVEVCNMHCVYTSWQIISKYSFFHKGQSLYIVSQNMIFREYINKSCFGYARTRCSISEIRTIDGALHSTYGFHLMLPFSRHPMATVVDDHPRFNAAQFCD